MGAREGSIKRVHIVRDKRSNESWRFGFAEFHTIDDARDALTKFHASGKFSISSEPVMVSYIHSGVFIPVLGAATQEHTIPATSNPSLRLAYWDENAYVSELKVSDDPPAGRSRSASPQAESKIPEAEPEAVLNPTADKKKRKADSERSSEKKKAMQLPSHLQFWSDRHAELHGEKKRAPAQPSDSDPAISSSPAKASTTTFKPRQSYADMNRMCCYLCMRQFKTRAGVRRHEQSSDTHHANLRDRAALAKAQAKLTKHGIKLRLVAAPHTEAANEYRDRAKERRQAFNQPKKPVSIQMGAKASSAAPVEEETAPIVSKGASLLGKMGYVAGQGLGSGGTGMTAPIQTDVYAAGVGLGAAGGKIGDAVEEATRSTKGDYKEFLERTKDKAKERYESMQ